MARKKIFSKPFDKVHTILYNEFPAEYIKTIGVPGVFVKKINRRVNLKNGAGGEMDSAFILDPDYKILHERVAGCLEHQSGPVKSIKLKVCFNSYLYFKMLLPCDVTAEEEAILELTPVQGIIQH